MADCTSPADHWKDSETTTAANRRLLQSATKSCVISKSIIHLEVVEVAVALDVVADEAHLQRRLRVFNHGRCHHHRSHGIVRLIVKLDPAYNAAPPRHLLHRYATHSEIKVKCAFEHFLFYLASRIKKM